MSRWQIKSVLYYSHHNERVRLNFTANAVNIIVGESYSGKSAIIETIDYCMGAGQCHIPGIVREASSWVGILWLKDSTEVLICRRVPSPENKSSEDVYFAIGSPADIPATASGLRKTTNMDGALRQFEQALLMGVVVGETFNEREGNRISFRNAMPYLLQSDDVIIDKITLLRGMNDERRRSIIDSIPYFLGAVDESTAKAEMRLRRLRSELEKEERKQEAARKSEEEQADRARALVEEAATLGLVPAVSAAGTELEALRGLSAWTPGDEVDPVGTDRLPDLQRQEREAVTRVARVRAQLAAAREVLESAEGFSRTVTRQREKLDVGSLFRASGERDTCPVCNAAVTDRTPTLEAINTALSQLTNELAEVNGDRPQIDSYVSRLEGEAAEGLRSLSAVREQITAVVRESEVAAERLGLAQRRMRVVGRVSYFLDSLGAMAVIPTARLEELRGQISELDGIANPEAKAERLDGLQLQVSGHATELLKKLPFDASYRDVHVHFDARKVAVRFVRGARVMDMRDIGGDESYLSGHVSALLALHRVFAAGNRPVPGVVVFDQLSRPFYSPEANPGEIVITGSDRVDLKQYFDVLFDEVEAQKTLQVIVLEHAYFADDARYKAAVKTRWNATAKLIPTDWPRVGTSPPAEAS